MPLLYAAVSFCLLLLFSELSAGSFKNLSPLLSAWSHSRKHSGWEKVSLLCWAFGGLIPLLSFSLASFIFFQERKEVAMDLVFGVMVGNNSTALGFVFALVLWNGPLAFFRIRTMASPLFLLFATLAFVFTCLNGKIHFLEAMALWMLALAYALYFRAFSNEWKYYKSRSSGVIKEAITLPMVATLCMGVGFLFLAIVSALPFFQWLTTYSKTSGLSFSSLSVHIFPLMLFIPWIVRTALSLRSSNTQQAMNVTSITHTCLLNVLFLPGVLLFFQPLNVPLNIISLHFPMLLIFTIIYVVTLLVEKQQVGYKLSTCILLIYGIYTTIGLWK